MSTVTDPTNIPNLASTGDLESRLTSEYEKWVKAKRSGDLSKQMRDARERFNKLLDEILLLRLEETII